MTNSFDVSYPRAPSHELKRLLKEGFLAPICRLPEKQTITDCHLDVQFRSNDQINVYLGSACILDISAKRGGIVLISADPAYTKHGEGLFREWTDDDSGFEETLQGYLRKVVRKFPPQNEGTVQERWSLARDHPWTTFDREARLNYKSKEQRKKAIEFSEVDKAHEILQKIARCRPNRFPGSWKEPPKRPDNQQLDQLGIDARGNLVLVELKHASATDSSSIYYSPLQLLRYIHEWDAALGRSNGGIRRQLDAVIEARRDLGLMPPGVNLGDKIRAAICFAEDDRTEEVKRRFYEVLGVVNSHLPRGVSPIETWIWPKVETRPKSL